MDFFGLDGDDLGLCSFEEVEDLEFGEHWDVFPGVDEDLSMEWGTLKSSRKLSFWLMEAVFLTFKQSMQLPRMVQTTLITVIEFYFRAKSSRRYS